ncbi:MAG: hypothetical protein HYR94_03825 [Chloroflexi bacterium]|nr:hypothetical protein [Chloroflexota bacterium]
MEKQSGQTKLKREDVLSDIAYASGIILAISYPVLAISTGVRAIYQLIFKPDVTYYLPPALSAIAAACYLGATFGFAIRRKWAWWLSVGLLGSETLLTFVVGALSFLYPDVIGRTVWRHFGADYGYFPLFQPILGLIWLFSPPVLRAYGLMGNKAEEKSATNFTN